MYKNYLTRSQLFTSLLPEEPRGCDCKTKQNKDGRRCRESAVWFISIKMQKEEKKMLMLICATNGSVKCDKQTFAFVTLKAQMHRLLKFHMRCRYSALHSHYSERWRESMFILLKANRAQPVKKHTDSCQVAPLPPHPSSTLRLLLRFIHSYLIQRWRCVVSLCSRW